MDLVLDANVLFAALIREGTTRYIMLHKTPSPLKLYAPPFLLGETFGYISLLSRKTELPEKEISGFIFDLVSGANVEFVEEWMVGRHVNKAKGLSPDIKDVPYVATALYKKCGIWSNDKPLKAKGGVAVVDTKELLKLITAIP